MTGRYEPTEDDLIREALAEGMPAAFFDVYVYASPIDDAGFTITRKPTPPPWEFP